MAAQSAQWQWRYKGCGSFVFKIYWPFAPTPALGSGEAMHIPSGWRTSVGGFSCRRCADIAYESAERTSRSSTGWRVDPMDRFCRRLTAGRVAWRDVRQLMEQEDGSDRVNHLRYFHPKPRRSESSSAAPGSSETMIDARRSGFRGPRLQIVQNN